MFKTLHFKSLMLLLLVMVVGVSEAWAAASTYNFSNLPTSGWSKNGGSQTINNITWSYSSSTYIGENSGKIQVGSKNNSQTTAWTIQTPVSSFGTNKAIKSVSITAYTTATTATYDISVGGTSVKNGSLTTSSATYSATGLNVTSGNIVVTLTGSSTSKAMYLSNISVTYDDASSDPIISAPDNVEILSDATSGEFTYTISNPVENTSLTASITSGNEWLSNATVDASKGKVTFEATANTDEDDAREGTIRLVYGDNLATKDVTITQAAAPKKYTVTIEIPTGGILVVKNGENNVSNNDKLAVGTVLTITAKPSEGYNFRNWQAVDASTHTFTSETTYTMTEHDVTIKANFDAKEYHTVTWNINCNNSRTQQIEKGESLTFPNDIEDVEGKTFVGWVSEAITGVTDEEPTFVTSATMGDNDVTYYAVFAEKVSETKDVTKTYGFETESDPDWTIDGPVRNDTKHNTGSYAGRINTNKTYVTFKEKVKVKSFSFAFTRTSDNSNYNVYIETSNNNSTWTAVETYAMSSFNKDGTFTTKTHNFDGNTDLYVRFYCYNTTAERFVDDVTITYTGEQVSLSGYCTTVAPDTRALVNMKGFTAAATSIVKGNTTTTAVTNDQAGWEAAYTYESDNTEVATVDADGVITAVARGTANITATLNVDKNDANYKAGTTKSMSVEITVVNPSHTVAFYNNGIKLSEAEVEEEDNITFPSNPSFGTFEFVGWASAEIEGSVAAAPATVTSATMGTENVNYYAVYGDVQKKNVTATFDAAETSNLTKGSGLTWTDNETGIILSISGGQLYAGDDTHPAAWNITKSTNTTDYCMTLGRENCQIKKVSATTTAADYAVGDYYAYSKYDDENGTDLTDNVITNGLVSTLTLENNYELVALWSTTNYQTRLTVVEVEAVISATDAYYTTLAETANVTSAGWGTYVTKHDVEFEAGNAYVVTEADEKTTLVEVTEVPAGTPVLLKGAGTKTATFVATAPTAPTANLLHVSDGTINADAGAYVLGNKNGQVGFYKWTGTALAAGKVYLLPTTNAREFIGFDDDSTTTGINSIDNGQQTYDNVYDLQGRRVAQPAKGMYIVNGKKVIK